jgi:hypothetical protein
MVVAIVVQMAALAHMAKIAVVAILWGVVKVRDRKNHE